MIFSWPKTFDDAVKPLVYLNCHAGMVFFRPSNRSDAAYFFMKLCAIVVTFGNWAATYISFSALLLSSETEYDSSMIYVMYKILLCTNSSITVIAPFLVWRRRKGLTDCLQQMQILDDYFHAILGVQNEYRRQYIRLICQGIAIASVMLLMGICNVMLNINKELQVMITTIPAQLHPILVMLTLDVNFCTFVGYLGKKFRDLNDSLLELGKKRPTFSPEGRLFIIPQYIARITPGNKRRNIENRSLINEKHYLLQEIRKTYLEVCKFSRKINIAFGIQNLLSIGISFVMITGWSYFICKSFSTDILTNGTLTNVISTIFLTSIYMLKIWMINHNCWSVSKEAARTGEVIYELFKSKVDEEFREEIQQFSLQMLQNPVHFDACGFFTLNYTFVQGMIGSITTYLVILIQMSNVSESNTSNSIANDTGIAANLSDI